MKKFLAIFAIAGTLVACNDGAEGTNSGDTTTVAPMDTTSTMPMTPAPADTTGGMMDTTGTGTTDTTGGAQ